jgi:light-regulated signal transduction histidine kinase (bacteriophytochrome)
MATLVSIEAEGARTKEFEDIQRATLNILEDFDTEKRTLEQVQSAALNLLDDFDSEKRRLEDIQRATVNILDDFNSERSRSEHGQRALLNILEDMDSEKSKVAEANQQLETVNRELEGEVATRARAEKEIKELNASLEGHVTERTAELAASNKELEAFAYSVSHDLRAPLRHMDGFLALLIKQTTGRLDNTSNRYLDKVTAASRTMGILIDDLLQFSRMGRSAISKTPVNVARLVEEIRQEFEAETAGRNVRWELGPLPQVLADPTMLRLVMTNLISNALKFTRPRAEARIEINSAPSEGAEDVIFVKDNGVGFDAQYVAKLFNVFQRLHPANEFEGTGIGLANVRRIIERHGGRVWAEGAEGAGAAFYLSLPRIKQYGDHKP